MSIADPRKAVVAAGYDIIAERYLEWLGGAQVRNYYLRLFYDLVPVGGHVLDLGCGAGVPVAKKLAERASVVGVDISAIQVALVQRTLKCVAVEGEKLHQHIESGASFTSQAIPLARPMR